MNFLLKPPRTQKMLRALFLYLHYRRPLKIVACFLSTSITSTMRRSIIGLISLFFKDIHKAHRAVICRDAQGLSWEKVGQT